MTTLDKINQCISCQNWDAFLKIATPETIVDLLSYTEAMLLVGHLVHASEQRIDTEEFAVDIMILLRDKYSKEWKEDWKNEPFLGICCAFVYRYEDAFKFCKNAYENHPDPPQSLILAYLHAGSSFDTFFLTEQEITSLTKQALTKGVTQESASQMSFLAGKEGNKREEAYWQEKAEEADKQNLHTPILTPNILKNLFKTPEGYANEN